MNKNQIIATVVVGGTLVVAAIAHAFDKQLQNRFPTINKKIVRKAYLNMLAKGLTNEYGDMSSLDDGSMDALFMGEVLKLQTK